MKTHGNAAVAWKVLVKGPDRDDVASNIETLIAEFEGLLNQPDVFIEWVPVGAVLDPLRGSWPGEVAADASVGAVLRHQGHVLRS